MDPISFQKLKDALTTDPRLNVTVIREPDYYAQQSQVLQQVIRTVGITIAVLMGLGAVFGAVNTMYSAVSARTREIATLRALGFGSMPVVVSVLVEARPLPRHPGRPAAHRHCTSRVLTVCPGPVSIPRGEPPPAEQTAVKSSCILYVQRSCNTVERVNGIETS